MEFKLRRWLRYGGRRCGAFCFSVAHILGSLDSLRSISAYAPNGKLAFPSIFTGFSEPNATSVSHESGRVPFDLPSLRGTPVHEALAHDAADSGIGALAIADLPQVVFVVKFGHVKRRVFPTDVMVCHINRPLGVTA